MGKQNYTKHNTKREKGGGGISKLLKNRRLK
jgi:hypothetical protein